MSREPAEQKVLRFKTDDILTKIEVAVQKAWTINSDLGNTYFDKVNPEIFVLQGSYKDAVTKNDIVSDYLYEIDKELKELWQLFRKEEAGTEEWAGEKAVESVRSGCSLE